MNLDLAPPFFERRRHRLEARSVDPEPEPCGWWTALPTPGPARRLQGELRADCVVLGAGFTGLAAARRLAHLRPDWRITLVEGRRAGLGASARSSGFVVDRAGFIAAMPAPHGERFVRLSQAGIRELDAIRSEHDIACDWDTAGWLHVAAGEPGLTSLRELRGWLEQEEVDFRWLDDDGMRVVTGSGFYRAGIRLPGSVLVQPAALIQGLATTLPENVELLEESPVKHLTLGPPARLQTAEGSILGERLVLATNAYGPRLGILRHRLFPLLTFGSLSRPLTRPEQEELGGEQQWGLLAQDPMGSTVRRTADQRLLIRNTLHYRADLTVGPRVWARVRDHHRRALAARFPQLAELELESTWGGAMGATVDRNIAFGRLAPGVFTAGGYTGAGIAMGTTCGLLLAELAAGQTPTLLEDMAALPAPRWFPPQPLRDPGIRWQVRRMNAEAGPDL